MNKLTGQTGGCPCGKVRYRLLADPLFVHCCHCRWCQRESGSAFNINMLIEGSNVEILPASAESAYDFEQHNLTEVTKIATANQTTGHPVKFVPTPSSSRNGQDYWRCPECEVALWSNYEGAGPAISFVRGGTLDNAALVVPDVHIFTSTKVPWIKLPDGANVFENYYDKDKLWPAKSLERIRILIESLSAAS